MEFLQIERKREKERFETTLTSGSQERYDHLMKLRRFLNKILKDPNFLQALETGVITLRGTRDSDEKKIYEELKLAHAAIFDATHLQSAKKTLSDWIKANKDDLKATKGAAGFFKMQAGSVSEIKKICDSKEANSDFFDFQMLQVLVKTTSEEKNREQQLAHAKAQLGKNKLENYEEKKGHLDEPLQYKLYNLLNTVLARLINHEIDPLEFEIALNNGLKELGNTPADRKKAAEEARAGAGATPNPAAGAGAGSAAEADVGPSTPGLRRSNPSDD